MNTVRGFPSALIVALHASLAALAACGGPPTGGTSTQRVAYAVSGMHCSGCAEAIRAEVGAVKGVAGVHCTFAAKCAVVDLADPASKDAAEHAITKMGYTISPCEVPASLPDREAEPAGAPSPAAR